MTEHEWTRCRAPHVLLEFVRSCPGPRTRRWLLFNLACCQGLSDLLTEEYRAYLHGIESWLEVTPRGGHEPPGCDRLTFLYKDSFPGVTRRGERDARVFAAAAVRVLHNLNNEASDSASVALTKMLPPGQRVPARRGVRQGHADWLRDIFGNPFRPVTLDAAWLTSDVVAIARGIYEERAFDRMPILADALQDAGCDNDEILNHCRGDGPHVRGCWVVDLLLGNE